MGWRVANGTNLLQLLECWKQKLFVFFSDLKTKDFLRGEEEPSGRQPSSCCCFSLLFSSLYNLKHKGRRFKPLVGEYLWDHQSLASFVISYFHAFVYEPHFLKVSFGGGFIWAQRGCNILTTGPALPQTSSRAGDVTTSRSFNRRTPCCVLLPQNKRERSSQIRIVVTTKYFCIRTLQRPKCWSIFTFL